MVKKADKKVAKKTDKPKVKPKAKPKRQVNQAKQNNKQNTANFSAMSETQLFRQSLNPKLAWLLGDNELNLLVKMDTSIKVVNAILLKRLIFLIAPTFLTIIIAIIARKLAIAPIGLVIGGILFFNSIRATSAYYRTFALRRQVAFAQFTRMCAAYLPELKDGINLYSLFEKIVPRLNDPNDRTALQRLMINMQIDPKDPKPFLDFAKAFSVNERADLIMLTIQQMYLGDVDDSNIRSLAKDANHDLERQIDEVIRIKSQRFHSTTMKVSMVGFGVTIMILGAGIVTQVIESISPAIHSAGSGGL